MHHGKKTYTMSKGLYNSSLSIKTSKTYASALGNQLFFLLDLTNEDPQLVA